MKLEHGKFYKDREGNKVGPMYRKYEEIAYRWGCDEYGFMAVRYDDCGVRYGPCREGDLVSEWVEGPVRTVTRREIVPGTYGRVKVLEDGRIGITSCDFDHYKSLTAEELREAAHLFNQLAEALEDKS